MQESIRQAEARAKPAAEVQARAAAAPSITNVLHQFNAVDARTAIQTNVNVDARSVAFHQHNLNVQMNDHHKTIVNEVVNNNRNLQQVINHFGNKPDPDLMEIEAPPNQPPLPPPGGAGAVAQAVRAIEDRS